MLATQSPGTKVDFPLNSSWNPCCNQNTCFSRQIWHEIGRVGQTWPTTQKIREVMPTAGDCRRVESGRKYGRNIMYQRKYCRRLNIIMEIQARANLPDSCKPC